MGALPNTRSGFDPFTCISAFQKAVRRSNPELAVTFCVEMANSSQAYTTMIMNRMRIITFEDIGPADTVAALYVLECLRQAEILLAARKEEFMMALTAGAIAMACARKSRVTLNLLVTCLDNLARGKVAVPDEYYDMHTLRGKQMKRGIDHFFEEGARLVQPHQVEAIDDPTADGVDEAETFATGKAAAAYAGNAERLFKTSAGKYGDGSDPAPKPWWSGWWSEASVARKKAEVARAEQIEQEGKSQAGGLFDQD
jgi:hypothetical protein